MNYLQAAIFAIIEGITEFLPISSTGHLVLTAKLLNIQQTEFTKSFEIIIQLGAISAVVFLYWRVLIEKKAIWKNVFVAFLPTAAIGFTLYKIAKGFLLGNTTITLAALFLGGLLLIFLEYKHKEKDYHASSIETLTLKQSFFIGVFQSISIIPGVSRAAATIIGALFLGAKRKTAVEFSFLLAIPTMLAASGLDIARSNFSFTSQEFILLAIGFFGSFIVAVIAVKFLLTFIQKHTFIPFGIYRILLALIFWFMVK